MSRTFTILMKDMQEFMGVITELFSRQMSGKARFSNNQRLSLELAGKTVEFLSGGEVFFFNVNRDLMGQSKKRSRSTGYFFVSDGKNQITVEAGSTTAKVTWTKLQNYGRESA